MLSLQQVTLEVARYRWFGAKRWSPLLEDISFELARGVGGVSGWQWGREKPVIAVTTRFAARQYPLNGEDIP